MGRKTVRWKDIPDVTPGFNTCPKCDNHGIYQYYDHEFGQTFYPYCDCYYGQMEFEAMKYSNTGSFLQE